MHAQARMRVFARFSLQGCVDSALSPGAPAGHHANSAMAGKPSTATNWICLVLTLFRALHSTFISTPKFS
jgi:hypothetical protein